MSVQYAPLLEALTRLRGIRGALVVSCDDGLGVAESLIGRASLPTLSDCPTPC